MKNILLITIALFTVSVNAQLLYSVDFNNYTLGNLGTDPDGFIPGQGGWFTEIYAGSKQNNFSTITNETSKGKVLTVASSVPTELFKMYIFTKGLNSEIDKRNIGNNVIKFEFDFYTGPIQVNSNVNDISAINIYFENWGNNTIQTKLLARVEHNQSTGKIWFAYQKDINQRIRIDSSLVLPYDTWITFKVYLDYDNKKAYFETPYFNTVAVGDFLSQITSTNLIDDFKPSGLLYNMSKITGGGQRINKLDNIKITGLNAVPQSVINLSINNFLEEKFNLYPNPATNVVSITNNENMLVEKIKVYDTSGKHLSTQSVNSESEIQLNVENLSSGTYILHLETNRGTAVKKLVKK